ncbi:MAG: SCO family protein [Rhodobacteraceae bacterium]|nr:SCO family protein [Paracoccaceae bacterium]
MAVSTKSMAIAGVASLAILLTATYSLTRKSGLDAFVSCRATKVSGAASIGGPFTLIDENGRQVTERDVMSKPALVYFGYTSCPDVCPTDAARNAEAVDVLEEQGYEVTPVFISVDPKRDTPAVLKEWTDYLHPRMIGLTGSQEQIREVAKQYRTFYQVPDATEDDNYLVDHMTQTYLMIPGIGFADFFNREDTADVIAERTACFLQAAETLKK